MNSPKKLAMKSNKGGKIKLAQEEAVAALPIQSGVRAGVVAPVSFRSFKSFSSQG